jgi:HD-GYP domain-containing protein (c-di-GMP phosphodiesterase class II)
MTDGMPSHDEAQPSLADSLQSTERALRQGGRDFLIQLYTGLRSLKLYPVENAQVQRALADVTKSANRLLELEDELEVRVAGEFIFVNATRLRLDLDNFASFSHVLTTLRQSGIGVVRVDSAVQPREWQVFISLLLTFAAREPTPNKIFELQQKLVQGGVERIVVEPPFEADEELEDEEKAKEVAKRTYERTVAVTKEVVNSVRAGRSASVKKVKRAVQGIVDQVLKNEVSIMGLTTIRDYDEYTFVHSVNVTIFSVLIGKRLGLTKVQLYDLGLAALFHDVGKSRVPLEVLNKETGLDDDEWRIMQAHPWLGVLTLFGLRGYGEIPYRAMIAAYEHHMKIDLTGYPRSIRPRQLSVYSKIIAVADAFDAATSRRVYKTVPLQPADVLQEMWENPRRGQDPVLVKAFINLTGIYPVGTCVILDTYEVAVVHGPNPDPAHLPRPLVRVVLDSGGVSTGEGFVVNLAETDGDGSFNRSIIKVANPERYGINPSDYFV